MQIQSTHLVSNIHTKTNNTQTIYIKQVKTQLPYNLKKSDQCPDLPGYYGVASYYFCNKLVEM